MNNGQKFISQMIHDIMNKITNLSLSLEMQESYDDLELRLKDLIKIVSLYRSINDHEISWELLDNTTIISEHKNDFLLFVASAIIYLCSNHYKIHVDSNKIHFLTKCYGNPLDGQYGLNLYFQELLINAGKQTIFQNNNTLLFIKK